MLSQIPICEAREPSSCGRRRREAAGTLRRRECRSGRNRPLEQERFARRSRERVGKTVARVQACLVPAFAEVEKSLPSQVACSMVTGSTTTPARRRKASAWRAPSGPSWLSTTLRVRHGSPPDPADVGGAEAFNEAPRLRLPIEDGDEGGRVEDHLGRPCSSYKSSAWST